MLNMRIKHGGFQGSCCKRLLEVHGRVEPCDMLPKGTDKSFQVHIQTTCMSVQVFSVLTLALLNTGLQLQITFW